MNNETDRQLEQLIHRELRQLPDLRAPGGLVARVQRAIASQTALPWWSQSWFAWPRLAQGASAFAAFALVVAVGWMFGLGRLPAGPAGGTLTELTAVTNAGLTVLNAVSNSIGLPTSTFLAIAAAVLTLMYLGCLALGTLFYRVAVNPR